MQAATYLGVEQMVIQDVPRPVCGDHELLLKLNLVGLCGSDVKAYYQGRGNLVPPQILGHEVVGTVIEAGKDVQGYPIGDVVALATEVGCGHCDWCVRGLYKFCENDGPLGWKYDGGFAEYMLIPEQAVRQGNAIHIPSHLPFEEAVFLEPLACCVNAQSFLHFSPTDTVAIIGAGSNGCIHAKLARLQPVSKLMLINSASQKRMDMAREAGAKADVYITASEEDPVERVMAETGGLGADIVIVSAPSSAAQELAVKLAARGGQISLFAGLPQNSPPVIIDTNALHYREITMYGGFSSTLDQCLQARDLMADGLIELAPIITHHFDLKDIVEAITTFKAGDTLKAAIHLPNAGAP